MAPERRETAREHVRNALQLIVGLRDQTPVLVFVADEDYAAFETAVQAIRERLIEALAAMEGGNV